MSQLNTADLTSQNNSNITSNGNNEITGAILRAHLKNIIDSMYNRLDDKLLGREIGTYIIIEASDNSTTNGTRLVNAYATMKVAAPYGGALSTTKRGVIILMPGTYTVTGGALVLDTEFIDIIGVGQKEDILITSTGIAVRQTADDVRLKNLTLESTSGSAAHSAYHPDSALSNTILEDIKLNSSGLANVTRQGITYSGKYLRVETTKDYLFGGAATICSGTFTDCSADDFAFGPTASGTFTDCSADQYCFGGGLTTSGGTASGTFKRCKATIQSFGGGGDGASIGDLGEAGAGGNGGEASGTFIDCEAGNQSFGGGGGGGAGGSDVNGAGGTGGSGGIGGNGGTPGNGVDGGPGGGGGAGGTASGTFKRCTAGERSFGGRGINGSAGQGASPQPGGAGGGGTTSGTFIECESTQYSFGYDGSCGGKFELCNFKNKPDYCFGSGANGDASGEFDYCYGGDKCFGGEGGVASGKFRNCRAQDYSFGGSTVTGTFSDCHGGTFCFGYKASAPAASVSGSFFSCTGGANCFGGGVADNSGVYVNCRCEEGFSNGGGTLSGELLNCQMKGAEWLGSFTGRMENCRWEVTGANKTALTVAAIGKVYNCTLIGTGTGKSIDAAAPATNAVITHTRTNKTIGANVNNLIGTPYNVDDANIA